MVSSCFDHLECYGIVLMILMIILFNLACIGTFISKISKKQIRVILFSFLLNSSILIVFTVSNIYYPQYVSISFIICLFITLAIGLRLMVFYARHAEKKCR